MGVDFCIIIIFESKKAKPNAITFKLICGRTCREYK
jgi:hypothetical protein